MPVLEITQVNSFYIAGEPPRHRHPRLWQYWTRQCFPEQSGVGHPQPLTPLLFYLKPNVGLFLQLVVFEEQEADGKIHFASRPDLGMTVDVRWGREGAWGGGGGASASHPVILLQNRYTSLHMTFSYYFGNTSVENERDQWEFLT